MFEASSSTTLSHCIPYSIPRFFFLAPFSSSSSVVGCSIPRVSHHSITQLWMDLVYADIMYSSKVRPYETSRITALIY